MTTASKAAKDAAKAKAEAAEARAEAKRVAKERAQAKEDAGEPTHTIVRSFTMGNRQFHVGDEHELVDLTPRELSLARGLEHIKRVPVPAPAPAKRGLVAKVEE